LIEPPPGVRALYGESAAHVVVPGVEKVTFRRFSKALSDANFAAGGDFF
jgi:hypothetical protein